MNRISFLIFFLFSSIFIFGQDTVNLIDAQGRRQGVWKKSDSIGRKIYEGQFTDGKPTGIFRYYYPDGKLKTESAFSFGGRKAKSVSYYPNGRKMASGNYFDEKKDSVWQFFSEIDGVLLSEENYHLGVKDGFSKTYFPGGGLAELMSWKNGIKSGPWEQYFSDGKIKFRGNYQENEKSGAFQAFYLSGKIMFRGQYLNGHQSGLWLYYEENGKLLKKEQY